MKPTAAWTGTDSELITLVDELLDAQTDTLELSATGAGGLRWAAHLDYLRALRRRAKEILAHASAPESQP